MAYDGASHPQKRGPEKSSSKSAWNRQSRRDKKEGGPENADFARHVKAAVEVREPPYPHDAGRGEKNPQHEAKKSDHASLQSFVHASVPMNPNPPKAKARSK